MYYQWKWLSAYKRLINNIVRRLVYLLFFYRKLINTAGRNLINNRVKIRFTSRTHNKYEHACYDSTNNVPLFIINVNVDWAGGGIVGSRRHHVCDPLLARGSLPARHVTDAWLLGRLLWLVGGGSKSSDVTLPWWPCDAVSSPASRDQSVLRSYFRVTPMWIHRSVLG